MNQNDFNMQRYQVAPGAVSGSESAVSKSFLFNVYNWMAMGLAITGAVAYGLVAYFGESELFVFFQTNTFALIFLIILQLGLVLLLSFALKKIPSIVAFGAFLLYSAITGVTLSTVFILYTGFINCIYSLYRDIYCSDIFRLCRNVSERQRFWLHNQNGFV